MDGRSVSERKGVRRREIYMYKKGRGKGEMERAREGVCEGKREKQTDTKKG